jgi:septal ring factor EnvC (AmiA/AmiB activator)
MGHPSWLPVVCAFAILLLAKSLAAAQDRHDPLNRDEINQLRDTAPEPEKRLALYVKFIKARTTALEQLYSDPRLQSDRAARLHDLLDDIDNLVQQLDDNIDAYANRHADLRKPLRAVIEFESAWEPKLRAMRESSHPHDLEVYGFVLDDTLHALHDSSEGARQLLKEQEVTFQAAKGK